MKAEEEMNETEELMEQILHRDNLNLAYKKVVSNHGSAGIDGMRVEELLGYLKEEGESIREKLMEGRYKPKAVKSVEIPKANGDKRTLGIPTAVDRVIQQAICQILTPTRLPPNKL